ncbi:FAD-dependent oxidoreductase [Sulfitobacter sp. SK012]|uniref:NAD(P)/FAD-dependent oxidoreductase n=1 Tax=Sulfitobacter sp. SK012 TaxID=1389005 RepID=UPI000E09F09C|nr:FAD-binding oxidoreductase [Sulfitobacter sp. SK012]AXI45919.1 FAD-dependent oxidoreductase [Sulfitobacter sp. SK012]
MNSYRAKTTPQFATQAAWNTILGAAPDGPVLEGRHTADVVIIGAGFAGLSAARRLRQLDASARIVVLDALPIAEGTAGRNSGFMIDLPHDLASDDYAGTGDDRAMIALNRAAIRFARSAVAEYQIDPAYADPVGKVNGAAGAAGEAHNRSYGAHLAQLGEASEMLDRQSMQELTGSSYYASGLYTPGTLILQPAGYIRGLAMGLRRDGVEIFERSAVTGFERQGTDWAVTTGQGTVTAPKIILGTNGHLESFGIAKGRLIQLFLFASMTPELDKDQLRRLGGAPRWGVTPSDPVGTTMRRIDSAQGGNRIITRTCASVRPGMQAGGGDVARAAKAQRGKFDARFPQLAGLGMAHEWAGHLCLTRNGVAVTGEIDSGVFSACVQNGLGTARGTLTGIAAAEQAAGEHSDITKHFASEAKPRSLPPEPFATWGANAYLRWKERRAGAE